ncbi:unnamed protein product [Caenorhabditis auriculariae]|uniref:MH1 domain-containing protein n=1 Tax=Caenorhabditis auriculariae TaxID=2777116 RepID=A0A8S1HRY7_9PELO|nr:unnamed protein product [Caenorhabditis auriculariae]
MHRYNHVTADQHPAFESLSAQYEPEVVSLARKVVQETILTEGSGDLEYPFKAARAISKTIRKFNKMAEFQEAIYSADANTSCCMVQNEKRSFGRILIFSLKIFRFPWIRVDLEVRSSPACRNPYRRKSPMVCINPYHYNNVEVPSRPLPPVLINKNHDYSRPSLLFPETSGMDPVDVALLDNVPDPTDWKTIPNVTMRGDELRQVYVDLAQNQQLDIGSPTSTIMSPTSANAAHQYPSNISSPAR